MLFAKSRGVVALERAAEKELLRLGKGKPRDAFLASMARQYCRKVRTTVRDEVMGAAILTVGMRGFLRAGEIMGLKFKHVVVHFGYISLKLGTRKNWLRNAPLIFLDKSGTVTCPVENLVRWMRMRRRELGRCGPEDYVFSTKKGNSTPISYKIISDLVRGAARAAGVEGNFSGHSLRIGGATEAMLAGFSELEIRIMGDWKSNAYMRYLRGVQPAAMGASRKMGL